MVGVAIQPKETPPGPNGHNSSSNSEFHQLNLCRSEGSAVTADAIGEWSGMEAKSFSGVQPMDLDPFGVCLCSPELTDQIFLR